MKYIILALFFSLSSFALATERGNDWLVLKNDRAISLQHKSNSDYELTYYCGPSGYYTLDFGTIKYISFPDSHDIRESFEQPYSLYIDDKDLMERILSVDEIKLYSFIHFNSTFDVTLFDVASLNAAIKKYQPVIDECVNRETEKEMLETGVSQERLYNVEVLSISVVLLLTMVLILGGVSYLAKKAAKAKRD